MNEIIQQYGALGAWKILLPALRVWRKRQRYANGRVESTNYQLIHQMDHGETVHLIYDEKRISLREILLLLF